MEAQPQQQMTAAPAANMQPQPIMVASVQQPFAQNPNHLNYKRIINGLAISEIVLGTIFVLLGIVMFFVSFSFGQGIWCGAWVLVAGALGVPSAKMYSSRCMVTCHFAFSIVAAVFAAVLTALSVLFAVFSFSIGGLVVNALVALAAFAALILCIISACYSGALISCCSQAGPQDFGMPGQVYTQHTIAVQETPVNQPDFFVQGYQPGVVPVYQNVSSQPTAQHPVQPTPQVVPNPNAQYPEKQQEVMGQTNAGMNSDRSQLL